MSKKAGFWTALIVGAVVSVGTVILISCGNHKRHKHTVRVEDRPIVVNFVDDRSDEDQTVIIDSLKEELDRWEAEHGDPEINITVLVENDIDIEVEGDVDEVNGNIRCRPWNNRCRIYHALCKWHKKKCNRDICRNNPKPCDNEDD